LDEAPYHKAYGEYRDEAAYTLDLGTDGDEWSASSSGHFTPTMPWRGS